MLFKQFGIGKATDIKFRQNFGINLKTKEPFVTNKHKTSFNRTNLKLLKGQKLFLQIKENIDFHKNEIKSYVGSRHRKGYPVRGQRTHTNATRKVAKKKKFF